jgi:putative polyketide hydroxylase
MSHFPVIIIGGGPVGLSMALLLAQQKIHCLLVEKHPHTTNHPKARGVNGRSMEIFRQLGLESHLEKYKLPAEATRFIWLEDFQGQEVTRVEDNTDYAKQSPTTRAVIAQDNVEDELYNKAVNSEYIDLHFNMKMTSAEQNSERVLITVVNQASNETTQVTGDYLIGADGAYSSLRDIFGVNMQGADNLGEFCNIYCEMNLDRYIAHRPSVGFMFTREDILGTFILAKAGFQKWLVGVRLRDEAGFSKDMFTDDYCVQFVKDVVRDDSVDVKLINKGFWTMAALIADQYRVGRVFLAGDAAHRLPPTGGFGMNTGIQDAHNLAWKLAFVLNGYANDSLLNTYESERLPIAYTNIMWSNKNAERFNKIYSSLIEEDYQSFKNALADQTNHLNNINLDLGFIYGQDYANHSDFQQTSVVGGRAPHCWLKSHDKTYSTLDLFVDKYILLCAKESEHWHSVLKNKPFPYQILVIGKEGDYEDINQDFSQLYDIDNDGAVLVRPDGHIAWIGKNQQAEFDYHLD